MVMRHAQAIGYLEAYAPHELSATVRERLDAHLAGCPPCAARARETASFQALLAEVAAGSSPAGFETAVDTVRRNTLHAVRTGALTPGPVEAFLGQFSFRPIFSSLAIAAVLGFALLLKQGVSDDVVRRPSSVALAPTTLQASHSLNFIMVRNGSAIKIEWPATGREHRVRKATSPASLRAAADRVITGKTYIEPVGVQDPGNATFYLID